MEDKDGGHYCLFLVSKGKLSTFYHYEISCWLFINTLYHIKKVPFFSRLVNNFLF